MNIFNHLGLVFVLILASYSLSLNSAVVAPARPVEINPQGPVAPYNSTQQMLQQQLYQQQQQSYSQSSPVNYPLYNSNYNAYDYSDYLHAPATHDAYPNPANTQRPLSSYLQGQ